MPKLSITFATLACLFCFGCAPKPLTLEERSLIAKDAVFGWVNKESYRWKCGELVPMSVIEEANKPCCMFRGVTTSIDPETGADINEGAETMICYYCPKDPDQWFSVPVSFTSRSSRTAHVGESGPVPIDKAACPVIYGVGSDIITK